MEEFVQLHLGPEAEASSGLGALLFDTTNGNPLFVTETLRDLEERWHAADTLRPLAELAAANGDALRRSLLLRRNHRVQEIILERIGRLPPGRRTPS